MSDPRETPLLEPIQCPLCGGMNKAHPAKPVIVREQDGSYSCTYCGAAFRLPRKANATGPDAA